MLPEPGWIRNNKIKANPPNKECNAAWPVFQSQYFVGNISWWPQTAKTFKRNKISGPTSSPTLYMPKQAAFGGTAADIKLNAHCVKSIEPWGYNSKHPPSMSTCELQNYKLFIIKPNNRNAIQDLNVLVKCYCCKQYFKLVQGASVDYALGRVQLFLDVPRCISLMPISPNVISQKVSCISTRRLECPSKISQT